MSLTVLIAPSGPERALPVNDMIAAISAGIRGAMPDATILPMPMPDGGKGSARALVHATGGRMMPVMVTGPDGDPVAGFWGVLGGKPRPTAVIDMSAFATGTAPASAMHDPARQTSRGVGELILKALDHGVRHILIDCDGAGVPDGGAGMARALGVRFYDAMGAHLPDGGGALTRLARIDFGGLDPRLQSARIDAAIIGQDTLTGPRGVARMFAQQGIGAAQADLLDAGLNSYAALIRDETGIDLAIAPGGGAAGGLGAGLRAFAAARLHPRRDIIAEYLGIDHLLGRADLVITAAGLPAGQGPCPAPRR